MEGGEGFHLFSHPPSLPLPTSPGIILFLCLVNWRAQNPLLGIEQKNKWEICKVDLLPLLDKAVKTVHAVHISLSCAAGLLALIFFISSFRFPPSVYYQETRLRRNYCLFYAFLFQNRQPVQSHGQHLPEDSKQAQAFLRTRYTMGRRLYFISNRRFVESA